tara:strand:+ start:29381 stop:30295 length:915 start_codon:yes stop_codon:yes gene_type:complete
MKFSRMKIIFLVMAFCSISIIAKTSLKLGTYNIRNFGTSESFSSNKSLKDEQSSLRWQLKKIDSDILAVQEVVDDKEFKSFIKRYFPKYKVVLSKCGGNGKQKLGFVYNSSKLRLINYTEDSSIKDYEPCHEGLRPVFIANFKIITDRTVFTAMAIHLKAGGYPDSIKTRVRQFGILSKIIKKQKAKGNKKLIVLGDFNTTEYKSRNQYYEKFIKFVESNKLTDFSEEIECSSYWNGGENDGIFHSSLLDHILVSQEFLSHFWTYEVNNHAHCKRSRCRQETEESLGFTFKEISDHCPIMATLE